MDRTTRGLLVAFVALLAVALGFSTLMGGMMGPGFAGSFSGSGPGMMSGRPWLWGLGMGLGGLVMLTFWGALIVGIFLAVRAATGRASGGRHTPMEILKRRYAAGEITKDQYAEMRRELER